MEKINLFLLAVILLSWGTDALKCEPGWVMYKDELCVQIFHSAVSYNEAQNICSAQDESEASKSSLVMIKDADMQQFIENYSQGNFDNLWLGGKYDKEASQFRWVDGEPISYWQQGYPSNVTEAGTCLEFIPVNLKRSAVRGGSWANVLCQKQNQVMCQTSVSWSLDELVAEMMKIRKELAVSRDEHSVTKQKLSASLVDLLATRADLAVTQVSLSTTQLDLSETQSSLSLTQRDLASVISRVVPVGSIYIEYRNQPSPVTLWPSETWEDITSTYAGLFFRAYGGGSANWGTIQTECAPRITQMELSGHSSYSSVRNPLTIPLNGWSEVGYAGVNYATGTLTYEGLKYKTEGCEVRPRNQAIRIWKRTA